MTTLAITAGAEFLSGSRAAALSTGEPDDEGEQRKYGTHREACKEVRRDQERCLATNAERVHIVCPDAHDECAGVYIGRSKLVRAPPAGRGLDRYVHAPFRRKR